MRRFLLCTLFALCVPAVACADPCAAEDFRTFVSGKEQCLVMRRFGVDRPKVMVVWLHGDVSSGDPANYHFSPARRLAEQQRTQDLLSVALVRPGYPDGEGNTSSVSSSDAGRQDHGLPGIGIHCSSERFSAAARLPAREEPVQQPTSLVCVNARRQPSANERFRD